MPDRPRRVLVVDDDAQILDLLTTCLSGFETRTARNGEEALRSLPAFRPQAMILDINMPVMDGFQVLVNMRAQGLLAVTPTMVLTARNNSADVAKAVQLGARDYLSKPFSRAQLLQRVGRLLAHSRLDADEAARPITRQAPAGGK